MERCLGDSTVVLCTLSMLSNPTLDNCWMFKINPVKKLIVDEASQINVFDYMVSYRNIHLEVAGQSYIKATQA